MTKKEERQLVAHKAKLKQPKGMKRVNRRHANTSANGNPRGMFGWSNPTKGPYGVFGRTHA